jgi:hypothetical protein
MGLFDWPITKKTTQNMDNCKIEDCVAIKKYCPKKSQKYSQFFGQKMQKKKSLVG